MPEMQVSHIYIQSWKQNFLCSVKTLFWDGVGEVVPYIIGYYSIPNTRYYFNFFEY